MKAPRLATALDHPREPFHDSGAGPAVACPAPSQGSLLRLDRSVISSKDATRSWNSTSIAIAAGLRLYKLILYVLFSLAKEYFRTALHLDFPRSILSACLHAF
jgi:hypothetical protein